MPVQTQNYWTEDRALLGGGMRPVITVPRRETSEARQRLMRSNKFLGE